MSVARRLTGWIALIAYLSMGALCYLTIIPGADGHSPPDFRLTGYGVDDVAPFVNNLTDEAGAAYATLLGRWDAVFIIALAAWLMLMGWRGGWLRYAVAGLAVVYAGTDFAEDAAIYQFVFVEVLEPNVVAVASSLTMAKFASLYLTVLVLIWHIRRDRT